MARFAKGMKVWKTFHGIGGFTEEGEDVVESVKDGVVRTEECENGITFNAVTGRELENFFPPMYQSIIPLSEKGKAAQQTAPKPTPKPRQPKGATPKPSARTSKPRGARSAVSRRLTLEDCANPMFDSQRPVRRMVQCRGHREEAFEWVTVTDQYVKVGITYFLRDGLLSIVAFDPRNAKLFDRVVTTPDEFSAAMKIADRAHRRLMDRLADRGAGHRCAD